MIIPVRCFTCGAVVGSAYEEYKEGLEAGKSSKDALDATGLQRFCCRRMIVGHKDLVKDAAPYE